MKFYSTRNRGHLVSFRHAVTTGLAPDRGLYMPRFIPKLSGQFIQTLSERSFTENAFFIAREFVNDDVPDLPLKHLIEQTITFDCPLVKIDDHCYALELFHGPTLAFKDFGARFLAQLFGYWSKQTDRKTIILAATSGDTGSAVANGFFNIPGTHVVVLYPSGKVSDIQERQFTTLGGNITALAVDGTFDDCQRLVKDAFQDTDLHKKFLLTSANSINIGRLIPQIFYYFHAYSQLVDKSLPMIVSVPSGNFGNLTAGLVGKKMGLPVDRFVVATNVNDVVPEFFRTEIFQPRASQSTLSNAMDVGNPSNFERMMELFEDHIDRLRQNVSAYSVTDFQTAQAIKEVYRSSKYLLDPHGAVAYVALRRQQTEHATTANRIFLATAHPAKFHESVSEIIGGAVGIPPRLQRFLEKTKRAINIKPDLTTFKNELEKLI